MLKTHRSGKACCHADEESEDGHQHAGLAEPPEHPTQGGSVSSLCLQLLVPQGLQPGDRGEKLSKQRTDQDFALGKDR